MKLKKLIENLPLKAHGSKDVEITGLCSHSKMIAPGNLFVMKKGTKDDGSKYAEEAISSGAVAILSDFFNPFIKDAVQLVHPDVSMMEAELSSRFYGNPSQSLFTVGVTGTSGKTTTAYLIKHLFEGANILTGLIGTIEYIIGSFHFESDLTTPDVITNQKLLKEMVKNGLQAAVLEVSSHGLSQKRVEKIDFDIGVFTNLSQDHLDYHESMEDYAKEKAKLFSSLHKESTAVVNADSKWTPHILQNCTAKKFTFGFSKESDLCADDFHLSEDHTEFNVTFKGKKEKFSWDLIGRFNIYNCLAALSVCLVKGIPFEQLSPYVETFSSAPGRLEKVENLAHLNIFVDYAHKPDALEKVLSCLKEIKKGKLITVFGCGGNRDRKKRAIMGEIADRLSDFTIVTSDNPRNENPKEIIDEIVKGFFSDRFLIEVDRRQAIEKAIRMATPEDLILIAGKGHEAYQIFSHQTVPFDDRKAAQEIANRIHTFA